MEKIDLTTPEAQSADLIRANVEQLKALFPELLTEGPEGVAVNVDVLKALVGDRTVTDADEKYGLNWHGKRRARQLALTPSTGTLRPCPEDSVDWDTTQNLMIEGDNLEVLKLLQKSYAGKVKLIYIDPPYNTGKDFVYADDFRDNIKNYLELTGQVEGGRKISSNTDASGRFHTDWLNMMYPRLKLARSLLSQEGALFVSIADHETHNLRACLDEVFGPENFIATVVWHKMDSPKNTAIHFSEDHDYILVYAKESSLWRPRALERSQGMIDRYKNPDNDHRGSWLLSDLAARNYYSQGQYPITTKVGRVIEGPPAGSYWRVSKEKFDELDRDNRIWWGENGDNRPGIKRFLSEVRDGVVPQTYWNWKDVGSTRNAKQEFSQLMESAAGEDIFITPKPVKLVERVISIGTRPDQEDIVMDFFAGSGTTGHATLASNIKDDGNRRYLVVQLPEPTGQVRHTTISEMTKERLRRAGKKIKDDNPLFSGDTGFRVFKLDRSNIRAWSPDPNDLEQSLFAHQDHLVEGRSETDILFELLLKLGLDLCVPIEQRVIGDDTVYAVGGGVLLACLAATIAREAVEALARGIIDWHQELAPAGDTTCVFRDSAFANDIAKTNLAAILEQHGIKNVRSL